MAGFFTRLLGKKTPQIQDAERLYARLMTQSRRVEFYGPERIADGYDGRVECLTLHITVLFKALRRHGEQGERLAQALYDVMRDDFDVALREEGLSDTGVAKRIKPMMALFFTRAKAYESALNDADPVEALVAALTPNLVSVENAAFARSLAAYCTAFSQSLDRLSLGEIAKAKFDVTEILTEQQKQA